jgi:hypothetical protein
MLTDGIKFHVDRYTMHAPINISLGGDSDGTDRQTDTDRQHPYSINIVILGPAARRPVGGVEIPNFRDIETVIFPACRVNCRKIRGEENGLVQSGWPPVLESTGNTGKYWKQKLVLENTGKQCFFIPSTGKYWIFDPSCRI